MKTKLILVALIAGAAARADFSYTMTTKGSNPAGGAGQETKTYLKGNRMLIDSGASETIMDFDAQTLTQINKGAKSYTVTKFADLGQAAGAAGNTDVKVDVKETGETKTINGFKATQVVLTMAIDSPQIQRSGMKMQMEMEIWSSPDVPGAQDLAAFYRRNADKFPWSSLAGGAGNQGMAGAMAQLRKAMANLKGVPVLQIVRAKNAGAGGDQAAAAQADPRMAAARAQLEAMVKQGGPGAAQAQAALARMGGGSGGGRALFESTMESSNFSTSPIPDSLFAIPAGFQQSQR